METLLTSNSKPGDRLAAPPPCDGSRLAVSAHLVGLLHEVDLAELQDDREVDGFLAHSPRFLVEVHLLEDLWRKTHRLSRLNSDRTARRRRVRMGQHSHTL